MRVPLSAFEAFAEDSRNPSPAGAEADERARAWLTIASAAETLGSLRGKKRSEFLREFDDTLLPPAGRRPTIVHDVAPAPAEGLGLVTERFRVAAEEMERSGFLNLAYTTVSALCRVVVREDRSMRLMTTMHLGRIARQLSDLSVAIDCYRSVAIEGLRERDGPAAAKGYIGLALVSVMRGNFPLARDMFERVVSLAHPGSHSQGLGHMGLANIARRQGKYADALLHGWRAHDLATDSNERLAILGNLSTVALDAGFPGAAMNGFLHVLSLAQSPESVLGVLDSAMLAAAALDDERRLLEFEQLGFKTSEAYQQQYEIARINLASANAWKQLGRFERARSRFVRSMEIAVANGFNELSVRAEAALAALDKSEKQTPLGETSESFAAREFDADEEFNEGIARLAMLAV